MILYATEVGGRGVLSAVSSDGRVKQRLSVQSNCVSARTRLEVRNRATDTIRRQNFPFSSPPAIALGVHTIISASPCP